MEDWRLVKATQTAVRDQIIPTPSAVKPRLSPIVSLGIGVAAVSTASLFVRMAQQSEVPSLAIAALRLTMAALILFPLAWVRCRDELRRLSRRDLAIAFACGAFLGLHFATWISSLQFTSVASSVMLVTVSPLFVALGSALFLREKLTGLALTGIAIAIAGGLLISLGDSGNSAGGTAPNPLLGNSLALCGALSIAVYFLIGRRLRLRLSLLAYVSVVYGAAAAVLLTAALVTQTPLTGFDPRAYAWIAALALIPQLIGHTSFNWALGHLPTTYATIPALGEPVGATLLAVLLLNESLTTLTVVGGILTLGGILLMSVKRSGAAREER